MIQIIKLMIAAVPLTALFNAYKNKYAEKKGINPDSPDAIIGFAKRIAAKCVLFLLCTTTVMGMFFSMESNRELFCTWLEGIRPYAEAAARSLPPIAVLYALFLLSIALFCFIVFLIDGSTDVVKKTKAATFKGLYIGLFVGGFTIIAIEFFCMSAGNLNFVIELFRKTPAIALYTVMYGAYIASICFFIYVVCQAGKTISDWVKRKMVATKYSGKHYKK